MSTRRIEVGIDVSAIPAKPAGAGRYVLELVRSLAARDDISMRLYSRRGDEARWRELASPPHRVLGIAPPGRAGRILYGELALGGVARRGRPPLEVFHGPHYSLPRGRAAAEVVTVHDLTLVEHPEWHERLKVAYFGGAMRRAATRAERIIVLSDGDRRGFVERFAPRGEVVVIPHGVDHERFSPAEVEPGSDRTLRRRRGLVEPYVLHVGTIEPRKNLPVLLDAFERLLERRPGLRLVLAGTPAWGTDELERNLERSPARAAVSLLGYVSDDEVPALIRGAAVVAYPSSAEGFGIPVLEALACGAPTVTTEGTVMADVAGGAALLARAGDRAGLAAALEEAMSGGEAAELRRTTGLRRAAEFTWERSAAAHVEVYRAAASTSRVM